jgi:hypothetical protein
VASAATQACPPPSAPSNLNATAASQTRIDLTWQDNSSDETNFHIERSPDGVSDWTEIAIVEANGTSYGDTGLSCGTTYYYRVRAHRHTDWRYSGYSNVANATTQACPPGPPNDDFDDALVITSVPYNNVQDTTWATTASDDPEFTCRSGQRYHTVWYRFTPSSNGTMTVDTFGSAYDTVLAVWTGTRGALQSEGCNDDAGGTLQSQVEVPVSAGTTCYIEVAGYSSEACGSLHLIITMVGSDKKVYLPIIMKDRP